jgi:RNA polymerase sigma factor (sigma-70 family)
MSDVSLRTHLQRQHKAVSQEETADLCDGELLRQLVANPEGPALEALVWRHGPMVLGVCQRMLSHEQDSEDAFQAVMLTLMRRAGSIRQPGALGGWLYRVACRVAREIRLQRSSRRARERPFVEQATNASPEEVLRADLRALLDEEILRLPQRYQLPLILYYFEGKTIDQVAQVLSRPPGTVGTWLARARERLRGRLKRRGVGVGSVALAAAFTEFGRHAPVPPKLAAATVSGILQPVPNGPGAPMLVSARARNVAERVRRLAVRATVQSAALLFVGVLMLGSAAGGLLRTKLATVEQASPPPARIAVSAWGVLPLTEEEDVVARAKRHRSWAVAPQPFQASAPHLRGPNLAGWIMHERDGGLLVNLTCLGSSRDIILADPRPIALDRVGARHPLEAVAAPRTAGCAIMQQFKLDPTILKGEEVAAIGVEVQAPLSPPTPPGASSLPVPAHSNPPMMGR